MDTINIDPLDVHANEMLAAAINAVEVVKSHTGQTSYTAAHAQAVLGIFTNLRELAKGTIYAGSSYQELPGGDPKSVAATNEGLRAMTAAVVAVTVPKPAPVQQPEATEHAAEQVAADVETQIAEQYKVAAE